MRKITDESAIAAEREKKKRTNRNGIVSALAPRPCSRRAARKNRSCRKPSNLRGRARAWAKTPWRPAEFRTKQEVLVPATSNLRLPRSCSESPRCSKCSRRRRAAGLIVIVRATSISGGCVEIADAANASRLFPGGDAPSWQNEPKVKCRAVSRSRAPRAFCYTLGVKSKQTQRKMKCV